MAGEDTCGNGRPRRWTTVSRWCMTDGSVSEAYPNEHGFCATAFLCAHLAAATNVLDLAPDLRLLRMASFLMTDSRNVPANQSAMAALSLSRVARLFDDGECRIGRDERCWSACLPSKTKAVASTNDGGADVGYQSITLSALAQIEIEGLVPPRPADRPAGGRLSRPCGGTGTADSNTGGRQPPGPVPVSLRPCPLRQADPGPAGRRLDLRPRDAAGLGPTIDTSRILPLDHLRTYLHLAA